jgi:AmmeMemoRadiSam system protein B
MSSFSSAKVRLPAVAGRFYSDDPEQLTTTIDQLLCEAKQKSLSNAPKVLIVPHAGYTYSGRVAAAGFAQIEQVERVVLLGCSHFDYFWYAALYGGDFWQTPLGHAEVDKDTVNRLLRSSVAFRVDDDVHQDEHSLEVQIPFLQRALGWFQIVPILVNRTTEAFRNAVSTEIARIIDSHTLLVVSSDLSHFPSLPDAEVVDGRTIRAILSGDIAEFTAVIEHQLHKHIPALKTCACGAEAIKLGLMIAEQLKLDSAQLLKYANSGHASGDISRVVGYGAIGFYSSSSSN